jgi:ribonuclease Z
LHNLKKNAVQTYQIPISKIQSIREGEELINDQGEVIPNHKLTLPPYKSRSYAYCTDTAYTEKIISIIKDVDLLFHEATFANDLKDQAKQTMHSTSQQAAKIAKMAEVKRLILGHFSARYKDVSPIINEAKEIFPNTCAAEDGEKYSIELQRAERS